MGLKLEHNEQKSSFKNFWATIENLIEKRLNLAKIKNKLKRKDEFETFDQIKKSMKTYFKAKNQN